MIKTFSLQDENFYKLLSPELREYLEGLKRSIDNGLIPFVRIKRVVHRNAWYNNFIGKRYEIDSYIIDTNNGYINFLVKSGKDGTKKGYKPQFSNFNKGRGFDIVHNIACEIEIG